MRNKRGTKKYGFRAIALLSMMGFVLTGCTGEVDDDDAMVIVERDNEEAPYTMTVATVDDVLKTQSIKCTYKQTNQEEIGFTVSGKKVETVYVEIGDAVKKGQLLADLEGSSNREDEIEQLEYQIARNKLLLSYTDINENYELSDKWWSFVYKSSQSESEREKLESSIESIKQSYRYEREDLEDAIYLDTLELNAILKEVEQGRIYASMDGEVSYIKAGLADWVTVADTSVITVIDSSRCLFESTQTTYAEYFKEGESIEMFVGYGNSAVPVQVVPYEMENWGDKLAFELLEDDSSLEVEVGTNATITLVLEKREQVLCIPADAVNTAEGKTYVYVLGENNIREVKWIETGLYGDNLVEVVSGLTEGENIILR